METEREISAKYSEGDLSLQNTMRAILVHTCARELIEMLDWRKFFVILFFLFQKIEIKYWLLFSQIIVPLCSKCDTIYDACEYCK